ncbi:MAG: metalloregulator ArsR/SmtB family transcription factor [Candidatus Zixiibacteriota bacterium]
MAREKTNDFSELSDPALELVAGCFQALSDPTRLKILRALKTEHKTVQDLCELFTCTQPNISRHLSVLTKAGLVKKAKRGYFVFYSVANPRIFNLCDNVCSHVRAMLDFYGEVVPKK